MSHESRIETGEPVIVELLRNMLHGKEQQEFEQFAGEGDFTLSLTLKTGYLRYLLLVEKHSNHADEMYHSMFDPSSKAAKHKFESEEHSIAAERDFLSKYFASTS